MYFKEFTFYKNKKESQNQGGNFFFLEEVVFRFTAIRSIMKLSVEYLSRIRNKNILTFQVLADAISFFRPNH